MITANDVQILAFLLNRLPMSPAEQAWAQGLILRLEALVAQPPEISDKGAETK